MFKKEYDKTHLTYVKRSFWNNVRSAIWKLLVLVVAIIFVLAVPMFSIRFLPLVCIGGTLIFIWAIWGLRSSIRGARADLALLQSGELEKAKRVIEDDEALYEGEIDFNQRLRK